MEMGGRNKMPAVIYLNAGPYTYLMIQEHLLNGSWSEAFVCNCGCTVTSVLEICLAQEMHLCQVSVHTHVHATITCMHGRIHVRTRAGLVNGDKDNNTEL